MNQPFEYERVTRMNVTVWQIFEQTNSQVVLAVCDTAEFAQRIVDALNREEDENEGRIMDELFSRG